jgi:hypothetical protein
MARTWARADGSAAIPRLRVPLPSSSQTRAPWCHRHAGCGSRARGAGRAVAHPRARCRGILNLHGAAAALAGRTALVCRALPPAAGAPCVRCRVHALTPANCGCVLAGAPAPPWRVLQKHSPGVWARCGTRRPRYPRPRRRLSCRRGACGATTEHTCARCSSRWASGQDKRACARGWQLHRSVAPPPRPTSSRLTLHGHAHVPQKQAIWVVTWCAPCWWGAHVAALACMLDRWEMATRMCMS